MFNSFLTFGDEKAPDASRTRGLKSSFYSLYENTANVRTRLPVNP
jgi:hypothetical protein